MPPRNALTKGRAAAAQRKEEEETARALGAVKSAQEGGREQDEERVTADKSSVSVKSSPGRRRGLPPPRMKMLPAAGRRGEEQEEVQEDGEADDQRQRSGFSGHVNVLGRMPQPEPYLGSEPYQIWWGTVERFFRQAPETPEDIKVAYVLAWLRGAALNICHEARSMDEIRACLQANFGGWDTNLSIREMIFRFQWASGAQVQERGAGVFQQLLDRAARLGQPVDQQSAVWAWIAAMPSRLKRHVLLRAPGTLAQAMAFAREAEATLQHYEEESSQPAATTSLQAMGAGPRRGQKEQRRCYICDRSEHLAARHWKKRKSRQSGTEKAMNSDAPQQHHSEEEKSKGEKRSVVERMKSTSDVTEVAVRSYGKDEKESRNEPGTKSRHTSNNGGGASLRAAARGGMMRKRNDLEAKNEKVTRPPEGEERVAYLSASDVQVAQAESRRARDRRQGKNEEKEEKKSSLEHTLLTATGEYGGAKVRVLFDSGASHNFIAQRVVERMQLRTKPSAQVKSVTLADGRVVEATGRVTEMLPLRVGTVEADVSCIVFPITGKTDLVLGKEFLTRYNPLIDFRKNDLTFVTERGEVTVNAAGPSPQMTASSAEVDMNIIDSVEARQLIAQGCELFSVWVEEEPVEERGGATLSSMAATDPVLNASQQQLIEAAANRSSTERIRGCDSRRAPLAPSTEKRSGPSHHH